MSTCIRGGSTYKRHKWIQRNKDHKECSHCHVERILDNGHWCPITQEESGWRNMPRVDYVMANIYPPNVPPTLGKRALEYDSGQEF